MAQDTNTDSAPCPKCAKLARIERELSAKEHALYVERERLRELEDLLKQWANELVELGAPSQKPRPTQPTDPRALMHEFDQRLERATAELMPANSFDG